MAARFVAHSAGPEASKDDLWTARRPVSLRAAEGAVAARSVAHSAGLEASKDDRVSSEGDAFERSILILSEFW